MAVLAAVAAVAAAVAAVAAGLIVDHVPEQRMVPKVS